MSFYTEKSCRKDQLLEALSFFLIRVPKREADDEKSGYEAFTILPRSPVVAKCADTSSAILRDSGIRLTVNAHREDSVYLEGSYRGQVNGEIQGSYEELARYEELADPKYTDTDGIFDIIAVTVIQSHLVAAV